MANSSAQVAWITGASSGIGEALAKDFVAQGGACILSGRNVGELERVAQESGAAERCLVLPFDTVDLTRLPSLVESALTFRGAIDVLVNNAGISQRSLAAATQLPVYERIIAVDLLAPIALTQALLPHLLARGAGHVVMVSSVAGKVGVPMRTAYCAAKHGLIGYADALRAEVAGLGVKVLVVAPGSVRTNVSRNALVADGSRRGVSDRAIDDGFAPEEVARRVWRAVADGTRELIIAEGLEAQMAALRAADPDKLFDLIESEMAAGYARRLQAQAQR